MSKSKFDIERLASMPYDVVEDILSYTDISDVQDLESTAKVACWANEARVGLGSESHITYEDILDACKARISVPRYLTRNFGNGVQLLEAMSKYCCYISGSRSLEFFNPGCTDEHSDWDFYVDSNCINVGGMMAILERLGVKWMTPEDEVQYYAVERKESPVMDYNKIIYLMHRSKFEFSSMSRTKLSDCDDGASCNFFTVASRDNRLLVERVDKGQGYISKTIMRIVRGVVKRNGTDIAIQLIVEQRGDRKHSILAPFMYHSSCVQSFIGPYTACHMYGKLTSEKKSYPWPGNTPGRYVSRIADYKMVLDESINRVPLWRKYRDRGFSYISPPEYFLGHSLRSATDHESVWLEYPDYSCVPRNVVDLYTAVSSGVTWFQVRNETVPVAFPFRHLYGSGMLDFRDWFSSNVPELILFRKCFETYVPHGEWTYNIPTYLSDEDSIELAMNHVSI